MQATDCHRNTVYTNCHRHASYWLSQTFNLTSRTYKLLTFTVTQVTDCHRNTVYTNCHRHVSSWLSQKYKLLTVTDIQAATLIVINTLTYCRCTQSESCPWWARHWGSAPASSSGGICYLHWCWFPRWRWPAQTPSWWLFSAKKDRSTYI